MRLTYSIADQSFARTKSLGILNVSVNLLNEISRRSDMEGLTVLSNHTLRDHLRLPPGVSVQEHEGPLRGALNRIAWDQWGVYRAAQKTGCSWLLLPKGYASFLRTPPVRLACIVHDAMNDHYRRNYPRTVASLESRYFARSLKAALRSSEILFTNSDFTRREVLRLAEEFRIDPPLVVTMGIGFSDDDPILKGSDDQRESVSRSHIMALVSRWPHKLTPMLIKQLVRWREEAHFTDPIYLVGALPDGLVVPEGMEFIPRPSDARYAALLSESRVLLFASDYEGFGMPPVEAVLAGAVPVYSDLPVTREVMQGAGCPFMNDEEDSFIAAMNRAMEVDAERVAQWATELKTRHNWSLVADRVVARLRSV